MGISTFRLTYESKQSRLGRLGCIAGRRSAFGFAVFLPAVRALAAVPTVVVAELAVVVPANWADLAGDGRLFNRAVIR